MMHALSGKPSLFYSFNVMSFDTKTLEDGKAIRQISELWYGGKSPANQEHRFQSGEKKENTYIVFKTLYIWGLGMEQDS